DPLDGQLDVVPLLRLRLERAEPELAGGEDEGRVRIGLAPTRRVGTDQNIVTAKQFGAGAARRLDRKDDVHPLVLVEVEEINLELAADMRLVVDAVVEGFAVNLDGSVGAWRVGRRGCR